MLWFPLVFGFMDESHAHVMPLTESFKAVNDPTWQLELKAGTYHIRSAELQFMVNLTGIRWLLQHWFVTSAFLGSLQLSGMYLIAFLIIWWRYSGIIIKHLVVSEDVEGSVDSSRNEMDEKSPLYMRPESASGFPKSEVLEQPKEDDQKVLAKLEQKED